MFLKLLFSISALLTVGGALAVVFTRNIMHCCIFLLATLFGVAGLYLTLGADFLAVTQVMVYIGGIVVLMLFAVMLTGGQENIKSPKTFYAQLVPSMGNKKTYLMGGFTIFVLLLSIGKFITKVFDKPVELITQNTFESSVEAIGTQLLTDHVYSFEIASVLLLGALIGAAIIARPIKFEREKKE